MGAQIRLGLIARIGNTGQGSDVHLRGVPSGREPGNEPYCAKVSPSQRSEGMRKDGAEDLTQNQLHELLETESARTLVEGAEERGFIELADFESFTVEHDLNDDEIEQL